MYGILTVAAKTTERRTNRFKALDENLAVFCNQLSWFIDNDFSSVIKTVVCLVLAVGFKNHYESDAELAR